jgi:hypothetical protein
MRAAVAAMRVRKLFGGHRLDWHHASDHTLERKMASRRVESRIRRFLLHSKTSMHIHILGICGTFMGGLAVLAKEAGHRVTGCDANVYPPMSTQLEAQGIELIQGYGPEQVSAEPDLYVIGNVMTRGNPLIEEILNRGLPMCRARSGSATISCATNGCWPWPVRTARPRPPRCWPGSSKMPAIRRAS